MYVCNSIPRVPVSRRLGLVVTEQRRDVQRRTPSQKTLELIVPVARWLVFPRDIARRLDLPRPGEASASDRASSTAIGGGRGESREPRPARREPASIPRLLSRSRQRRRPYRRARIHVSRARVEILERARAHRSPIVPVLARVLAVDGLGRGGTRGAASTRALRRPRASRGVVSRRERAHVRDGPGRVYSVVHGRGEFRAAESKANEDAGCGVGEDRLCGVDRADDGDGIATLGSRDSVARDEERAAEEVSTPSARDSAGGGVGAVVKRLGSGRCGGVEGELRRTEGSTKGRKRSSRTHLASTRGRTVLRLDEERGATTSRVRASQARRAPSRLDTDGVRVAGRPRHCARRRLTPSVSTTSAMYAAVGGPAARESSDVDFALPHSTVDRTCVRIDMISVL